MANLSTPVISDGKYELAIETGDHTPIGKDEPVFLLRAQDKNVVNTLRFYAALCAGDVEEALSMADTVIRDLDNGGDPGGSSTEHSVALHNTIKKFADWQTINEELVKRPD